MRYVVTPKVGGVNGGASTVLPKTMFAPYSKSFKAESQGKSKTRRKLKSLLLSRPCPNQSSALAFLSSKTPKTRNSRKSSSIAWCSGAKDN